MGPAGHVYIQGTMGVWMAVAAYTVRVAVTLETRKTDSTSEEAAAQSTEGSTDASGSILALNDMLLAHSLQTPHCLMIV